MRWEPECGWATFAARWSVAGGAGVFLAVSAATAAPDEAGPGMAGQDVRAVEIEPGVRAELARITDDAARARDADDRDDPESSDDDSSDDSGSDDESSGG